MRLYASDALLGMLVPFWQAVIAVCLVVATAIAGHRLLMRGPSRMSHALALTGGAVIGIILVGILFSMT
jgi:hypothetical protein